MIDKKKIEEAANKYAIDTYAFTDPVPIEYKEGIQEIFQTSINWFKENLWHDASEEPERVEEILIEQEINGKKQHQAYMFNGASFFREHCRKCGVTRWLYIEDLMKGDKK